MDPQIVAFADRIGSLLGDRRLATAESCTAGGIATALAAGDGASEWLLGGIVAYHRDVKYRVLGVPHGPVVNHRTAQAMARGVRRVLGADVSIAATGAAGPGGQDGAEAGTVFLAFVVDGACDSEEHRFDGEADDVIQAALLAALEGLLHRLERAVPDGTPQIA